MRTLKTLAAFAALLLVAGTANAYPILTLSVDDTDVDPLTTEIIVTLTFSPASDTQGGVNTLNFDYVFTGSTVGVSGTEYSVGGLDHTFNSPSTGGGPNAAGVGYAWSAATGPTSGPLVIARHTVLNWDGNADLDDSAAALLAETFYCATNDNTLCDFGGTDSGLAQINPIVAIPEPTTAALLGLGLVGLVVGGRRRS